VGAGATRPADAPQHASEEIEVLHLMTDHAAPIIAKLTAALATSHLVRL